MSVWIKKERKKDEQFGILANSALGAYWVVSVNFENLLGYRTLDYEGQAPKKANGCGFGRDFQAYLCIGLIMGCPSHPYIQGLPNL